MNNTGFVDLSLSFYFLLYLECKVFRDGQRFFKILFVDFVSVAATFHFTDHRSCLVSSLVRLVVMASYIAFLQSIFGWGLRQESKYMSPSDHCSIVLLCCCCYWQVECCQRRWKGHPPRPLAIPFNVWTRIAIGLTKLNEVFVSISGLVNLARTSFWEDITPSFHVSRLPMREVGGVKHLCMQRKMVYPDNKKSSIHQCWWSWFDHGHHAAASSNGIVVCIKS